ncbi:MAG TPA: hypothetical protein VGD81_11015 [Opitutaceae bacterium]
MGAAIIRSFFAIGSLVLAATTASAAAAPARFDVSPAGFIRHWLVAGPHTPPYTGPAGPDWKLRNEAPDTSTATPPSAAALGQPGPFGLSWQFHDTGRNEFVELSTFYKEPVVADAYAFTEISASPGGLRRARLWAAGAVDLWVNDEHVTRFNVTRYRYADAQAVTLPLKAGLNRFCVRVQCYGIRDTRMLFGLHLEESAGVAVIMPGAARLAEAQRWIDTVRAPQPDRLQSAIPAPIESRVLIAGREPLSWPAGAAQWTVDGRQWTGDRTPVGGDANGTTSSSTVHRQPSTASDLPSAVTVEAAVDGVVLQRQLDLPANRREPSPAPLDDAERRRAHLAYIARAGVGGEAPAAWNATAFPILARRLLAQDMPGSPPRERRDPGAPAPGHSDPASASEPLPSPTVHRPPSTASADATAFAEAIAVIDARRDCADFTFAALLRMELLHLLTPSESAELRRAALAFRYWVDEPGNDAMAFQSENHSLLFHGCQLIAGRLYPQDVFSNSGRRGEEQAAIAVPRLRAWLEKIEARGLEEFNSSTYMPITVAGMLNVIDFSGDPELSARMSALVDGVYRDLAQHAFGGGVITPQGRVYRDVLYPEDAGTQVMLSYATAAAGGVDLSSPRPPLGRGGDWVVFPASSRYRPPADLADLIRDPVSRVYHRADYEIVLEKTPAYLLTSLAVPAAPREGEHPTNDLRPGGAGYQQHLWQATLGRDCHVFVNHPGGFFDGTKSRPGYWHGSGNLPRVKQHANLLQAIHVIADGTQTQPEITRDAWQWPGASTVRPFAVHPIAFTHAHWPSDRFDREVTRGHWRFGQKGRGLIALWCSEPLTPHDDMLTGRELRANSYASAWLVICGDQEKEQSLDAFMAACEARRPVFNHKTYTLSVEGEEPTRWWERSEPMPR